MPLLFTLTAPVNKFSCVKVIGCAPALKLDVPGILSTPVCEIAPFAITVKLLPTVEAARIRSRSFVTLTLLTPLLLNVTAPVMRLF